MSTDDAKENLKDPMSGYASGDTLDPQAQVQDPMSGYASADALETKDVKTPSGS